MYDTPTPAATDTHTGLEIGVVAGAGRGPTPLAAFDDCLRVAGVSNYNLVRLSSVIPPGSAVREVDPDVAAAQWAVGTGSGAPGWGDRLYAVWAFSSAELLGAEAWAGVAWVQDPSDGRGLFVEHEGTSEAQVRSELTATLTEISQTRGMAHLAQRSVMVGTRCEGEPVGALVLAPYLAEPWSAPRPL